MAHVEIKGGRGGNGCISFEGSLLQFSVLSYHANISYIIVLAPGKKKPQGGNGGLGGNVYVIGDNTLTSLTFETFHFNAGDGKHGGGM